MIFNRDSNILSLEETERNEEMFDITVDGDHCYLVEGGLLVHNCVHDEVDLCIHRSVFKEVVPQVLELMRVQVPGCELKLRVDTEFGSSYGMLWGFHLDEMGEWVPNAI